MRGKQVHLRESCPKPKKPDSSRIDMFINNGSISIMGGAGCLMTIKFLEDGKIILIAIAAIIVAGCLSNQVEGVKISGDIVSAVGLAVNNQTDIQKIQWTVNIKNNGDRTAENVRGEVILHPAVVSRLIALEGSTVHLGDLEPDVWKEFKGNATFNATGLSKQDISSWEPLVKVKLTWEENGRPFEKTIPETSE